MPTAFDIEILHLLGPLDFAALAFLMLTWIATGWWVERIGARRPSVTVLMMAYRREWMEQMVLRMPRISDVTGLSSLRQGTSFFASTCVIAIGGVLALIGNAENLATVATGLGEADLPTVVWQLRLFPVALLLTDAFLKFVWANRLFGYCVVVMGAVPNDPDDPMARPRAAQAAELNIRAAWNFNRGLRAMYFALAAVAWLAGAWALIAATLVTGYIVLSRELWSRPREILIGKV